MSERQQFENKQQELYNRFIESDENTNFSKKDVVDILEAYKYKELMENYKQVKRKKPRNIMLTAEAFTKRFLSLENLFQFILLYLFYTGAFVLVNQFIYPNLFMNKPMVFIIALAFTLVDKLLRQFLFFAEFITFTFHKIGLITLVLFSGIFYFLGNNLNDQYHPITFGDTLFITIIVLFSVSIVSYIQNRSFIKRMLAEHYEEDDEDDEGSEDDE